MHTPCISVIIPVHNRAEFLTDAVESICQQTFSNWELLLVDDGSTDGSSALCDDFAAADQRISVYHLPINRGAGAARNEGLRHAQGTWVQFLDSDDWLEPHTFDTLLHHTKGVERIACAFRHVAAEWPTTLPQWEEHYFACAADMFTTYCRQADLVIRPVTNGLYLRSSLRCQFDEVLRHEEDLIFNIDYLPTCQGIRIIPSQLYNYRRNTPASLTKRLWGDSMPLAERGYNGLRELLGVNAAQYAPMLNRQIIDRVTNWIISVLTVPTIPDASRLVLLCTALESPLFLEDMLPLAWIDEINAPLWQLAQKKDIDGLLAHVAVRMECPPSVRETGLQNA